jgi:transcriptional regulator with XRE-family HTH domain
MLETKAHLPFAENLRLVMSRLNLSRVELAHRIGVDKSVVRRWVSGETRPSDVNLSGLTDIAAEEIPGFTRDHWGNTVDELTAFMGGALAPGHRPPPGLGGLLPKFALRAQAGQAQGLERYGGLWVVIFTVGDPAGGQTLFASGVLISEKNGTLWAEVSDGRSGIRSLAGPAFVADDMLWLMLEEQSSRNDLCVTLAHGSVGKALVFDGLYMLRSFVLGHPVSGRGTFFRLADLPAQSDRAKALFQAISDRAGELSRGRLIEVLPDGLADELLGASVGQRHPFILPLAREASLATLAIAADMLPAGRTTRRELVDAMKALFAVDLATANEA